MLEVGGLHPAWGDIHLGPDNALQALTLLGGGTFLPIHWGTFALATHDWDQPVEVLLTRAPKEGVRLLLPQLGEPVEPAHEHAVRPWWRAVDEQPASHLPSEPAITLPKAMPWPFD
jgi:L-ascorbate metabolism protein UlaG (beta-lactamase superfamily)